MAIPNTGINRIDSLLLNQSWSGGVTQPAAITYAFAEPSSGARALQVETNLHQIDPQFSAAVTSAMNVWSSYALINFNQVSTTAPLLIARTDTGLGADNAGVTYLNQDGARLTEVEAIIGEEYGATSEMVRGKYGYFTILHELGHALGLDHPFEGEVQLPVAEDTWDATIMSYTEGTYANLDNLPTTPMLYDIAAMQYLYGVNRATFAGNDRHTLSDGQLPSALWDGGGNDTLDASASAGAVTINLGEGLSAVNRLGSTELWLAFGSNIENALGGSANDSLTGNTLSNNLSANSGNDLISGLEGSDTLQGNQGNDNIGGGIGNDFIRGGQGADTIRGGQGSDTIYGDRGTDVLSGLAGNDIFVFDFPEAVNNVITDFTRGEDSLQFTSNLFANTDAVLAASRISGADTIITFFSGGSIILQSISSPLTSSDILIG